MLPIKHTVFLILCLSQFGVITSQSIEIQGKVTAGSELEGIHILNVSAEEYTITNENGGFKIPVKLKDTILVSSVQYIPQTIVVTEDIMVSKFLSVTLEDRINELDEVIVGKVLTGDLQSDIKNSDAKANLNFYDVGIPGYTGKPKTQKERRLLEADGGKFVYYLSLIHI